jgi:hypothetical protein
VRAPVVLLSVLLAVGCGHKPWENPVEQWKVVVSDHFVVRTDAAPKRYGPVIAHLEDVYEALSGTFFQGVKVPPIDVLLFSKQEDFEGVAPGNLLGFLTLRASSFEDGLLVLSADGEDLAAAEATAAHELAHRFLHAVNEKVPRWLHEGFAEYVAALDIRDGRVVFDAATVLPSWVYLEDPVPLDRLLTSGSGDFFGSDARAVYMTAWMLVRQLLGDPEPGVVDRLQRLIAHSSIATTPASRTAALSAAFDGADVADIQRGLLTSFQSLLRGDRPEGARRTLTFSLTRQNRRPWKVTPAERGAVKSLCAELRSQRGG